MNKKIMVYWIVAFVVYFMITSYKDGPGKNGWDCTGAEIGLGNPKGCGAAGFSCHHSTTASSSINISIELDSLGISTNNYVGGMSYTIKLKGINNGSSTLSKYGFQMGSIKGATAVNTPTNAGTWSSPFPSSTRYAAPQPGYFVVGVVEHTTPFSATTGSGGNGSTYEQTFNWVAPVAGTGTVSIWAAINAVNGNDLSDAGDLWNLNHLVINEWTSAIGMINKNKNEVNELEIYPNPAINYLNLKINNLQTGSYVLTVYDIDGKKIEFRNILVNNDYQTEYINIHEWQPGLYILSLEKEGVHHQIRFVKL